MNNHTKKNYNINYEKLQVFTVNNFDICDPVLTFDRIMEEICIEKYLKSEEDKETGRPRYNRVNMLKTVLFGFMDLGYTSLRKLEDQCKVNLRCSYLMNYETPSYRTFGNFITKEIAENIEDIFQAVMNYIKKEEQIDLQHLYIDGSKFEANANKYTWVWKNGIEKYKNNLFKNITSLLEEINKNLFSTGIHIETKDEYTVEYLQKILNQYSFIVKLNTTSFVNGRGHRKTIVQRHYERFIKYISKLQEFENKLEICGPNRNSYSKTDKDATFMRIKKDYMKNDQLLPAYNIQIGVADEYIAVVDVMQYRADIDCFIPLMEKFNKLYGFYPKYPIADAGYGSFNNYIYCQEHNMEKYMKFSMYKKETNDIKYSNDPFRAVNFRILSDGSLLCPNDKKLTFSYRTNIKGNKYGRQEEIYTCENCSECPYSKDCKKTNNNKIVHINRELTAIHKEVINNLENIHGALLTMNRSIQAEGTFGILKHNRKYKQLYRRGLKSVKLEFYFIAIGYNLYKFYNKQKKYYKLNKNKKEGYDI